MADGTRRAMIVASDDYTDPGLRRLRAPARDAEALAAVLRDPQIGGFEVHTLLNEPAHEVNLAVEEFFADRRPDDLLLVHFSCHGVKDEDGELYFATTNTRLRRLGATAVAAEFVNRRMNRSRSRRVVLLLDCCYAGAFERGMTARAGTGVGIEQHFGGRGRAVITASSAMEYAFEGDELADTQELQPSVFTSALVTGLETGEADRDQDGMVALDELYDYIYDKVREATPNQTPGKWTFGVQGELVIARRARPVTTPAALPPELLQATDHPLASVRAAAVQELERLLHGAHAGLALAARLALEGLVNDDSRTVVTAASAALGIQAPAPELIEPTPPRMARDDTATIRRGAPPAAPEERTDPGQTAPAPATPPRVEPAPPPTAGDDPATIRPGAPPAVSEEHTSRQSRFAGLLALGGALLMIVSLSMSYRDDTLLAIAEPPAPWWVRSLAALAAIAGACTLIPRTKRLIGPGLLLGAAPAATVGIVALINHGLRGEGWESGFWLLLVAHLILVLAALLAGLALARAGEGSLSLRRPQGRFPWLVASLGVVGAMATALQSQLSILGFPGLTAESVWATIMALVATACAALASPRRFGASLLAGWIGSGTVIFLSTYAWRNHQIAEEGSEIGSGPLIVFGITLLALVIVIMDSELDFGKRLTGIP
jgi:uncharacterized caspase-like protein